MNVGRRIKEIRDNAGLKAKFVAKKAGISLWYLSMIENGKRKPSLDKLEAIADVLGVEVEEFFKTHQVSTTLMDADVR